MIKYKVTLVMITLLLTAYGFGSVRSAKSMALPISSTTHAHSNPELDEKIKQYEQYLSGMQRELDIPGMSAAIIKDQELVWAQGFGYADVEAGRQATTDTTYEIASLTKPLSAAILLQLVEQGLVSLDDPISMYGMHIKAPGVIRVKHLLGMTSLGEPGSVFMYSGDRYGGLQKVIERAAGQPFPALMSESLLNPLGMSDSIPINRLNQPAYSHIRDRLSKPYGMNQTYIESFSTAAGLISSVLDLAKFDIALDKAQLLRPDTRALAFTPQALSSGDPPVYGMGWFVQDFNNTKMVWAFGYDAFTHLYLKFVDQGYTLIILTNSTALGDHISMRDLNVLRVPAALAFYKLFILDIALDALVNWEADEQVIATQLQTAREIGMFEIARQEFYNSSRTDLILNHTSAAQEKIKTYARYFASGEPPEFTLQTPFAIIEQVGNDRYSIVEFTLEQEAQIDIYAVGEYIYGKMRDYGGIEDLSSRKLIWVMTPERTTPAGGCSANRQVIDQMVLQPGTYRLHYRTNSWGHAFGDWDCPPPDRLFWGIALYSNPQISQVATSPITPKSKDELLPGVDTLTGTPVISNLEYVVLWSCLGIMLSTLIILPVLLYRVRHLSEIIAKVRRWTKIAGYVAWINSLLCLFQVVVTSKLVGSLEYVVQYPIIPVSTTPATGWVFVAVTYLSITLTILQVVFTVLAWKEKQRSLAERIYFTLATLATSGYLLLLGCWGLIAMPY